MGWFFDVAGIEWRYEPEGLVLPDGTYYLPDFLIKCGPYDDTDPARWFVEIKGDILADQEGIRKVRLLDDSPPRDVFGNLLVLGCIILTSKVFDLTIPPGWYFNPLRPMYDDRTESAAFDAMVERDLFGIDYETFHRACIAAKQARFEHGEQPRW